MVRDRVAAARREVDAEVHRNAIDEPEAMVVRVHRLGHPPVLQGHLVAVDRRGRSRPHPPRQRTGGRRSPLAADWERGGLRDQGDRRDPIGTLGRVRRRGDGREDEEREERERKTRGHEVLRAGVSGRVVAPGPG